MARCGKSGSKRIFRRWTRFDPGFGAWRARAIFDANELPRLTGEPPDGSE